VSAVSVRVLGVVWVAIAAVLTACDRPPVEARQVGFRGVAMEQVTNPRRTPDIVAANQIPPAAPLAETSGPRAGDVYQNVQVLGDLSLGQFARLMTALTVWVSPEQGCNYCHVAGNLASDGPYTKVVARKMLQMTQHVNQEWQDHVGATGVTCWTCHRGQNIPVNYWSTAPKGNGATRMVGNDAGQNKPGAGVGLASLPSDPFTAFLEQDNEIRVQSGTALPAGNRQSIKQTEWTYGLMMHFSTSLGVNCTFCHNSRAFMPWEGSTPQRVTAWHGIRMVRDINREYLLPLTDTVPAHRKGPEGDIFKVNCATCHQGVNKPLLGVSMVADYPSLRGAAKPGPAEVPLESEEPPETAETAMRD
jgi:photosynthetic reaction center cytochrome c subunit